jgi:hypothetical protein
MTGARPGNRPPSDRIAIAAVAIATATITTITNVLSLTRPPLTIAECKLTIGNADFRSPISDSRFPIGRQPLCELRLNAP